MDVAGQSVSLAGLVVLGTAVGLVAGMFGIGGGFLLTPLLAVVFGIPLPIAVGTGLCQMIGVATAALLRHRQHGHGAIRFDLILLGGSLAGVSAGAAAVGALERAGTLRFGGVSLPVVTPVLYGAYVALLLGSSWIFWRQAGPSAADLGLVRPGPLARVRLGPGVDLPTVPLPDVSALTIAYIGVLLGFVSGLLGIGGGIALLPVLIYGFGFPIKQAAGTGILALLVTVTAGTVQHALAGHVHLPLACVLLVGSTVSAQLGATLTHRLPAALLRRLLAVLFWATAGAIVWDVVRRLR